MTRHAIDYREHTMHRTIPTAKQMEDSRKTHYFRDDDDNRLVIVTELLPNGEYGAWVDGEGDGLHGIGYTMIEAIADLAAEIELVSE